MTSDLTTKAAEIRAGLEAIEHDPHDHSREYIPLPGGWEIQTKGAGSTYRLLDKKTGERHAILAGKDWFNLQAFFTRFAHEVFVASRDEREQQAAELAEARERLAAKISEVAGLQQSPLFKLKEDMRERAEAAESERDELLHEKERLEAALQKLHDAASVFHNAALVHLSDTTFDSDGGLSEADAELSVNALPGARSALENGPAGLADARSEPPDPSSQSERIAVLEAALRGMVQHAHETRGKAVEDAYAAARAALAPLGEE